MRIQHLLSLLAAGIIAFQPLTALAQASGAQDGNFLYRATRSDTLIGISTRYTLNANNWKTLQQLNSVQNPARLPIGFEIKIPFALIPEVASTARVTHISGSAHTGGRALAVDDQIGEGDVVTTSRDGFVTLTLSDSSVLTVPAASTLSIKRLRTFKGTGLIDSIITLDRGALESSVAPDHTGVGRFEVRTPLSITGVRGTHLRVRNTEQGAQSEVVKGTAHLESARLASTATLHTSQGTAVNPQGRILAVRPLLEAPVLPTPIRDGGDGWRMTFPGVPGASAYLVRVATDSAMTNLLSSRKFTSPDVTFGAPGAGWFHVAVRAIDPDGIEGNDATQRFQGAPVLVSSNGQSVLSGSGQPIMLTVY